MKRYRRLRRLVPDGELVRRRAAGETLRELAAGYGVSHTTLGRYFARPEIARQLKEAGRLVRRERQTAAARRAAERRLEGEVRRQAKEQVARERERRLGAARAMLGASRPGVRRRRRSAYEAWLDEHDARQPLTRADLRSRSDELAAHTVAAGGGVQVVIEATGLRTRENVLRLIDPVILVEALDNDAATAVAEPVPERLRRLVPDPELVQGRAVSEADATRLCRGWLSALLARRRGRAGVFEGGARPLVRLAASVVIEQNDEWLVGRRYLSNHSLETILDQESNEDRDREETRELTPA